MEAQTGGILREVFLGIQGASVADLTNAPSYPNSPSQVQILTNYFEAPSNFSDNYGQRLHGLLLPPQTGTYIFWIASDDQSVLYLSTDDNPANRVEIASVGGATNPREWDRESNQMSLPIRLEAGRVYYIVALMKEGGGADNLAVRWQLPDRTIEEPIPAWRLYPANAAIRPPVLSQQPTNTTVLEGGTAVFRVAVSNVDPVSYQWQRNGVDIPGAWFAAFTNLAVSISDHGTRFRCIVTNSLGTTNSAEAVLTVIPDQTPPTIVTVANIGTRSVQVIFSEPVLNADRATNYVLNNGITVQAVAGTDDPRIYVLATSSLALRTVYELAINNVTDRAAARNRVAPNTTKSFMTAEFAPRDIGDPALAGVLLPVANGYSMVAAGNGIRGTNDQFFFSYQTRSNDFDLKIRVQSLTPVNPWTQAGLMAREDLSAGCRFAAVFATPNLSGCYFASRQTNNSLVSLAGSFPSTPPSTWLRLQRQGDLFTGYASFDGDAWTLLGSARLALTNAIYLGLALSSRDTNQPARVELRDLNNVVGVPSLVNLSDGYEPLGPSSRRTGLVISEIMYHPLPRLDNRQLEYIELFNADSTPSDLSQYRIEGAIDYTFPAGTWLAAGAFLVLAKSPADMQSTYGLTNAMGPYANRLENQSGTVRLRNALGAVLLEARYSSDRPWPVAADGAGHSLVLDRPSFGEGQAEAWAASRFIGGSPGRSEERVTSKLDHVVINEFLAHTDPPVLDFIELYNHSAEPIDISGCVLTDDPRAYRFVMPVGTVIPPRGLAVFTEAQLGFALDSQGEAIYWMSSGRNRILDAVRYGAQAMGVASGRYPDGVTALSELAVPTPGEPNAPLRVREIVINEIMYHPISREADDEYIELYNQSTKEVPVGGWRFVDGIDFVLPDGASIPAGGYLVIAKNAARLLQNHPRVDPTNVVGDYGGTLANIGEQIALAMPQEMMVTNAGGVLTRFNTYVVVDEVPYREGGRWGRWSDGRGSSLELVDAHSDNRLAANWADSDESGKAPWTTVEYTGVLDHGDASFGINTLQILLMDEGECLVDNVELYGPSGENLAMNSTFDGGIAGLILRGNHKQSKLQSGGGINNSRCLRVIATGRGDTGPNQITIPLKTSLTAGSIATIRARVRWLRGSPEILFRLRGNFLEAAGRMTLSGDLGTPGAPNSRALANAGPAIYEVQHRPVLPHAFDPVLVTARVQDPDGIASVTLNYRFDPSITVRSVPMLDNGTGGDRVAGDGIYSAILPGQPSGQIMAFSVQAKDLRLPPATTTFPSDAPTRECLVRFGEDQMLGNLGIYRIWFTQSTQDEWTTREQGSNEPLDATFVYGNARVIYNMGALYSGSPFHWTRFNGPMSNACNYALIMPADDLFLGTSEYVLNIPSNLPNGDGTAIRERTTHFMAGQLGLPSTYRRFIRLYVNGLRRSSIYEDAQQPNREYVEEWCPENPDGELFKIEDWFEYNDSVSGFNSKDGTLDNFITANGEKKLASYRWTWRKRAVRGYAHDYTNLFALVDAVNTSDTNTYTQAVEAVMDVEQWMRTIALRHAVGDWDSYGYKRGKNMYAYKAEDARWVLMNWDVSFAFGLGDGTSFDIFYTTHLDGTLDPITDRMFKHPPFRRLYLQALYRIVNGPFRPGAVDAYLEAQYRALTDNGVTVDSPTTIRSWINSRRSYLEKVLSTNQAPFLVHFDPQTVSPTNQNLIRLEGTAPLEVKSIEVNGVAYPLGWSTVTSWSMVLPVFSGHNELSVKGYDPSGTLVTSANTNVVVDLPGPGDRPEDRLVINEIMYEAETPGAEYIELFNASALSYFDLSGYYFDGIDFVFPAGTLIPPQGYLLIVQDRQVFDATYGVHLPVAGEFQGRLNNAGETLRLIQPANASRLYTVIDEVTYSNDAPWPTVADASGSSLQLIDPSQDNDRVGNWTAVNTNGMAPPRWRYVSLTGKASASRLVLSLSAPGEVILDDLTLVAGLTPAGGPNLVRNGGFESPLTDGWTASADYSATEIAHTIRRSGSGALRLVSQGSNGSVLQEISPALTPGQYYTLSYWYYPGQSETELTVQIDGVGLTSQHSAQVEILARRTPGTLNSVRIPLGPLPSLWINEVQTQNISGPADASGKREPWLELFNSGTRSINLKDCYLTDHYTNLAQWAFPTDAVIHPGQFLLVWADGESSQTTASEWHASFRLGPAVGQVALSRVQNGMWIVLDYLDYTGLGLDQSIGSYPDANYHQREVFGVPTPRASNTNKPAPIQVLINEWMASNTTTLADPADGDFEDWFELYNAADHPVDLSRYMLSDNLANPAQWTFPDGTLIPAKGFLLVWADGETRQNDQGVGLHVNFRLSRDGEEIGLFDPNGKLADGVRFGVQSDDISEGRWPDGSAVIQRLPKPTPGLSNGGGKVVELRVDRIQVSASQIILYFSTEPGQTYLVQYKNNLPDPIWLSVGNPVTASTPQTIVSDPIPPGTVQRYYRIIKVVP
jgi:hypothetical protein